VVVVEPEPDDHLLVVPSMHEGLVARAGWRLMRVVRTRSIPNVDDERLLSDLARLHEAFHTPEGLRRFDAPRRSLFDNGMKARAISAELERRGHPAPSCRFCRNLSP
jgi:hypothetical protein